MSDEEEKFVLNNYQLAAVSAAEHTNDSIIIEAAPGSGKTATLAAMAQKTRVYGRGAIATAFIKKVVDELAIKLGLYAEPRTLHSVGRKMLVDAFPKMNGEVDKNKAHRHLLAAAKQEGVFISSKSLGSVLHAVDLAKANVCASPESVEAILKEEGPWLAKVPSLQLGKIIFDTLVRCGTDESSFDFSDMVWMPHVRGLSDRRFAQYDVAFCDELNDFTPAQAGIALNVADRFVGVGDGDQQLYAWNGADRKMIARLTRHLDIKTLRLPLSYRCAKRIVEEARAYSSNIEALPGAPEGTVESTILAEVASTHLRAKDFVLARTNLGVLNAYWDLTQLGCRVPIYIDGATYRLKLEALGYEAESRKVTPGNLAASAGVKVDTVMVLDKMWKMSGGTASGFCDLLAQAFTPNPDAALLMTIHQAKGRQADGVHLMSDVDNDRDDQETINRLLYVAITRAKTRLFYVLPF